MSDGAYEIGIGIFFSSTEVAFWKTNQLTGFCMSVTLACYIFKKAAFRIFFIRLCNASKNVTKVSTHDGVFF